MRTSDHDPILDPESIAAPPLRLSFAASDRRRASRWAEIWRRLRGVPRRRQNAERAVRQAQRRVDEMWRRIGGDS